MGGMKGYWGYVSGGMIRVYSNRHGVVQFYLEDWWGDVGFEGRLMSGVFGAHIWKLLWSVVLRGFRLLLQSLRGSAKAWRVVIR